MKSDNITLINKLGLHIRAANNLVNTAQRFESRITLTKDGKVADAKSIINLMLLGAACGQTLNLEVDGADEEAAFQAVTHLINNRFGESE